MAPALIGLCIAAVIFYYFRHNPLNHSPQFILRRFVNWFPLGMTYAFLYMARYNLNVSKNAFGTAMSKEDFGLIFGAGTVVYGLSFLLNGPLVDRFGGKRGMLLSAAGASAANVAMGWVTYLYLRGRFTGNLTVVFSLLYAINMYFQSFGAVSIIKVKAFWFHVRERGTFSGIFGTLISFGVYFAFDWGQAIADSARVAGGDGGLARVFRYLFATDLQPVDSTWLVFFIPAGLLVIWGSLDVWLIRDTPSEAGFLDFDTHDASSGEMDRTFTMLELLHRVFTSPLMLTFAAIEFTAGVIRNGIMQWYFIFAREQPQGSSVFFLNNWGLLLCLVGVIGGIVGGILSDNVFQSRRGPPVALAQVVMLAANIVLAVTLFTQPTMVGICALIMACAVIMTHSLMGTAATDFGGRKATATAAGIVDGFVYLGSGLQSVCLGYLTQRDWAYWPLFMMPFALIGLILAIKIWADLPEATRRFLDEREKTLLASTEHLLNEP